MNLSPRNFKLWDFTPKTNSSCYSLCILHPVTSAYPLRVHSLEVLIHYVRRRSTSFTFFIVFNTPLISLSLQYNYSLLSSFILLPFFTFQEDQPFASISKCHILLHMKKYCITCGYPVTFYCSYYRVELFLSLDYFIILLYRGSSWLHL